MAYSYVDLVASAGQQNFVFGFSYLNQNNISVFKNGTVLAGSDWTFLLANAIRLNVGAALNDVIRVKRTTPIDVAIVDYANGSVLSEQQLDATALQSLFAAQEVEDNLGGTIRQNAALKWDALNLPIINLATPTNPNDVANKSYVDTGANNAASHAAAAATSATNASNSAGAAASSASAAASSASAASSSASAASSSASAASASQTAAAASATQLIGTSSTSVLIGTGSKTWTTQTGKFFAAGTWLLITSDAAPANYMHGQVTSYIGTSLVVDVTNIGGSGTQNDWTIRVSGTRGAVGAQGAQGIQGIQGNPGVDGVGVPANAVVTETSFGQASAIGVNTTEFAREDHTHGTPTNPVPAHEAAGDPHAGYQLESEKDAANGYAGLTAGSKIKDNAVVTLSITDAAVTKAKMENADADSLLGRGNGGGAGVPQKITLGTNLSMSGTTLNAAGGGGGDSLIYEFW